MGNLGVFALVPVDVLGNETKREPLITPVKTNTHRLRCGAVCLGNGALVFALTCQQQWPWKAKKHATAQIHEFIALSSFTGTDRGVET